MLPGAGNVACISIFSVPARKRRINRQGRRIFSKSSGAPLMIGRGIMFSGPGEVSIDCFEVPSPGDGEILIETIYSGISLGTERAHLRAEPNTLTHGGYFPFRPGYSNVGRIIKVGAAISRFHIGQLVVTTLPHVSHATLGV